MNKLNLRTSAAWGVLGLLPLFFVGCSRRCPNEVRQPLQKQLAQLKGEPMAWVEMVRQSYKAANDCPQWCGEGKLSEQGKEALQQIKASAPTHGIDPAIYGLDGALRACEAASSPEAVVTADLKVTKAVTRHIADLRGGVMRRTSVEGIKMAERESLVEEEELKSAFSDGKPQSLYTVGTAYEYPVLQQRYLQLQGTGKPEEATLLANMERLRWLGEAKADITHVLVDIARFHVYAVKDGKVDSEQKIIVGEQGAASPMLADEVTLIIVNPRWVVPHSIASKELLPKLQGGTEWVQEQGFEVFKRGEGGKKVLMTQEEVANMDWGQYAEDSFPFALEQLPGEKNPLGRLEILFPNNQAVYLHDSPAKSLFASAQRMFSHGCIRMEKPMSLVTFLLQVGGTAESWPESRIQKTIESGERTKIELKSPVPIYLMYRTVWLSESGKLATVEDVYGWDAKIVETMKRMGAWRHGKTAE